MTVADGTLPRRLLAALLALGLAAGVAAEPQPSLTERYEAGLARLNRGDARGAIADLLGVLASDRDHLPARIALGTARLRDGDPAGAEKELRLARGLGAAPEQVDAPLGNALLAQRKYNDLLELVRPAREGAGDGFEVAVLRGRALFELGRREEAATAFARAGVLAPDRPEPLLGLAQVAAANSDYGAALRAVDGAIARAPRSAEAWFRKGEILRERGDGAAALAAYDEAAKIEPAALRVRLARAAVQLAAGNDAAARADLDAVRSHNPDDLGAAFLDWQLLTGRGAPGAKAALALVTGKLATYDDATLESEPFLLRIAALVYRANGDAARAAGYLRRYVELKPNDRIMRRLQGEVLLELGEAEDAVAALGPLYRESPDDLDVLLPLGEALLEVGHYSEAEGVLARAAARAPTGEAIADKLALARLGLGNLDAALEGLDAALARAPQDQGGRMLLALLAFKAGDAPRARATLEALAREAPRDADVRNLLGVMRAADGDRDGARQAFTEALALAPKDSAPDYNLARLALAEGETDAARQRLEALVAREPRADQALMMLADLALAADDRAQAVRWLDRAVAAQPDALDAEARLVALRLELGQRSEALAAAARMVERHPEDALAVESLAAAEAANGQTDQARRHYRDAARYAGFDGAQLLRLAEHLEALDDVAEARRTLIKALGSGAATEAREALVRLEIRAKDFAAAARRLDELRGDEVGDTRADLLAGELELARGDAAAATAAYERAQQRLPSTEGVVGLADALIAAHELARAGETLEAWLAKHPDDLTARETLAQVYLKANRLERARPLFEALRAEAPDDPVVLTSLARLYQLNGDPRARALAERAVELTPDSALALDTLGWIRVTAGDAAGGLELLRNAISRQASPLVRYHLAQALTELGRLDEARAELRKVLRAGQPAALMDDAQRYYDGLAAQQP